MRVLAVVRPDALAQPGGDVVHANHALAAVRALGTEVDVAATARPDAAGYDLAHVFGIFEPATARSQIAAIRASGTPLVLSPIWLDLRPFLTIAPEVERALESRDPRKRLLKLRDNEATLVRKGRHARAAERRLTMQRDCMLAADVVLPASNIEAYLYAERLGAGRVPFVVAPLGVDDAPFARAISGERAGILCAARIEPKKNQAALLYALRDLDVDVTLVGRAHDDRYLGLCKRWATPRTRFLEHVSQSELFTLMSRAAVHAHPSWLESPGLSSLEAAACGMQIVTGDRGSECEYFRSYAHYADPADPDSIRAALGAALAAGRRPLGDALEKRLRSFTWRQHAEATLDAYGRALAMHG